MKEFIKKLKVKIELDTNKNTDVINLYLNEFADETLDEFLQRIKDCLTNLLDFN